jgi:hypothetical protein
MVDIRTKSHKAFKKKQAFNGFASLFETHWFNCAEMPFACSCRSRRVPTYLPNPLGDLRWMRAHTYVPAPRAEPRAIEPIPRLHARCANGAEMA